MTKFARLLEMCFSSIFSVKKKTFNEAEKITFNEDSKSSYYF